MAIGAIKVAPVVEGLVGQAYVTVVRRRPGVGVVTQRTFLRRVEVIRCLACSNNPVVTGRARAQYLIMIDCGDRGPDIRVVAIFADVGSQNVVLVLTRGIRSVMAARTIVNNIRVVKIGGGPGDSGMAIVAVIAACDMRRGLPCRGHAIVARTAGANNLRVVNSDCRFERHSAVTVFACVGRLYVRGALANSSRAIVTGAA